MNDHGCAACPDPRMNVAKEAASCAPAPMIRVIKVPGSGAETRALAISPTMKLARMKTAMLVIGDHGCKRDAERVSSKCPEPRTCPWARSRTWRLADKNVCASMAVGESSKLPNRSLRISQ